MDEDPRELERKIEQASRIASRINDQTTLQRSTKFVDELRRKLRQHMDARRTKEENQGPRPGNRTQKARRFEAPG